ncbi:MAG TPA: metallophosphoesterase [Candidatus Faecivivens stercorigallinarum]|nr:metallophosphoesterase [Candidatus Faecivivens stercorigallinarum]
MSLFAISDLHLSLGVDKPMDVFRGWDHYVERLEENWKQLVRPEDTVVIAGDISWGLDLAETVEDFKWIDRMPGQKILLKGNHDLWFSTKSKVERFFQEQGFTTLKILFNNAYRYEDLVLCGTRGWMNDQTDKKVLNRECGRLRLSLEAGKKLGGTPVVFLHYPPVYGSGDCPEILEVLHQYQIERVYYGHIHGYSAGYAINGVREGIRFQLLSCDYLHFAPIKIV